MLEFRHSDVFVKRAPVFTPMSARITDLTPEQIAFAEKMASRLPLGQMLGMKLTELRTDEAVFTLEMRDDLRQPSGVLHGGVTATIIDTAMAFAVRTRFAPDEATATI